MIENCSEEEPAILTQESVYEDHWILELEIEGSLLEPSSWLKPNDKKFEKIIKMIVKGDKILRDRCCPNLFDSDVTRRLQSK